MRHLTLALSLLASLGAGCAGNAPGSPGGPTPPAPAIGELMDRAGRPLVSEVLAVPFGDSDAHASAAATWKTGGGAQRVALALPTLALYDALDGVCGDQLAAGAAGAERYRPLAELLSDDRLLIDSGAGDCRRVLAVEAGAAGDCGGLTPTLDSAEGMLSPLVNGAGSGAGDGVERDPDGAPSLTEFPFLLDPTL